MAISPVGLRKTTKDLSRKQLVSWKRSQTSVYQETHNVNMSLFLTYGFLRVLRGALSPSPFIYPASQPARNSFPSSSFEQQRYLQEAFLFSNNKPRLKRYDRYRGAAREMWVVRQLNCVPLHNGRSEVKTESPVFFRTEHSDASFVRYLSAPYQPYRCQVILSEIRKIYQIKLYKIVQEALYIYSLFKGAFFSD